jgi:hypothetical protein
MQLSFVFQLGVSRRFECECCLYLQAFKVFFNVDHSRRKHHFSSQSREPLTQRRVDSFQKAKILVYTAVRTLQIVCHSASEILTGNLNIGNYDSEYILSQNIVSCYSFKCCILTQALPNVLTQKFGCRFILSFLLFVFFKKFGKVTSRGRRRFPLSAPCEWASASPELLWRSAISLHSHLF